MKKSSEINVSRRRFIGTTATLVTGATLAPSLIGAPTIIKNFNKPDSFINGVQIGVITYSFRSMEDQSAEAVLKYVKECGISAIELMGDPAETFAGRPENPVDYRAFYSLRRKGRNGGELTEAEKKEVKEMQAQIDAHNKKVAKWRLTAPMDKFAQMRRMYEDAGVKIYGFKPSVFGRKSTDAEIIYGMQAAKALGASHVTLEHPSNDAHTKRLGKLARKNKVYVAYHGHEQQTPTFWDKSLKQSRYNALNIDIGHYVAAGNPSPLDILQAKHKRILSMHVKDRQTPANGKGNLSWGEGDTPIIPALKLISENKYKFPATIELEYQVPEGSDAVKEVAKCLEFCRKALG